MNEIQRKITCLLRPKDILQTSQTLLLPNTPKDIIGLKRVYKFYYFAENLQYYPFIHLHKLFIWGNTKYKVLEGSSFAVIPLACSYDEYFAKCLRPAERALIRKAKKNGFTARQIKYDEHLIDIQEINNSKSQRGGRDMISDYKYVVARDSIVSPYNPDIYTFGCFNKDGKLVAYYMFELFTNFFHTVKGIGHSDYLNMGIMNHLFAFSVSELSSIFKGKVLLYGLMNNDRKDGLSHFKANVGCTPKRLVYSGSNDQFKTLSFFLKKYKLHDDTALNLIRDYGDQTKSFEKKETAKTINCPEHNVKNI